MIRQASILFLASLLMLGCEAKLDVFQEDVITPIVYCLLDQDKTTQSLRLSRSYNSTRASEAPGSSDSLLFIRALDVVLEQVNGTTVEKRAFFIPIDVKKEEGFFPGTENWIYQTDMEILPNTTYKLIIYLNEFDKIIYSTCTTVTPFDIVNPAYPEVRDINFQTEHNPQFFWTKSTNAGIYQLGFFVHYDEYTGDQVERKTADFSFNTKFILDDYGQHYSQSINSNQFYIKFRDQLLTDPSIFRKFVGMDAYVICGGEELAYLIRLQSGGQTFSLMEYSNVYNGIGIFSSRLTRQTKGFNITDQSIDSLAYGKYTYDLNFMDRNGIREGGGI